MPDLNSIEKLILALPERLHARGIQDDSVVDFAVEKIVELAEECPDVRAIESAIEDLIADIQHERLNVKEKLEASQRKINQHYKSLGWNTRIPQKKIRHLIPQEEGLSTEEVVQSVFDKHFESKKGECLMGILRRKVQNDYNYLDPAEVREMLDMALDFSLPYTMLIETLDGAYESLRPELDSMQEIAKERHFELIRLKEEIASVEEIEQFYDEARAMERHFVCLIGPTNSGKTHHAVKVLKEAGNGQFLAPLRLLAREIYDDLRNSGFKANLLTGEEQIMDEEATISSSTIEKADLNNAYDVAIIDEAQFIGNSERGSAWTRAVLGVQAKTVFIVGSPACLEVVQKIVKTTGDTLEVRHFERLAELRCMEDPIGFEGLRAGDCIVVFSKREVYRLKYMLQDAGFVPSIVYGDLPPEVKIRQSELFNNGHHDILVATDAIGYGLNLKIKRLFLSSMQKFNGQETLTLTLEEFKQIVGRAGRYGHASQGWFGFFDGINPYADKDYRRFVKHSRRIAQIESVQYAHFFPEFEHVRDFAEVTETEVLTDLIAEYRRFFSQDSRHIYRLQSIESYYHNATIIEKLAPDLELERKYYLAFAPTKVYNKGKRDITELYFRDMIRAIAERRQFPFIRQLVDTEDIFACEEVCRKASLYRWMANRCNELPSYDVASSVYDEHKNLLNTLLESQQRQRVRKKSKNKKETKCRSKVRHRNKQ